MDREHGLSENTSEFVIEWVRGEEKAYVTVPFSALKSKIMRLADKYPAEVEIIKNNDDNSLYCKVPVKWVTIRRPKTVSEEQKQKASERFKQMWKDKGNG